MTATVSAKPKATKSKAGSVPPFSVSSALAVTQPPTIPVSSPIRLPSIHFDVTPEQIAKYKAKATSITFDDSEAYERGRVFLGELRTNRVAVDKRRKELKAGPQQWLKDVEEQAQSLMKGIEAVEVPLLQAKQVIDDAKALEKLRRENAERERLEAEAREKLRLEQEAIDKQKAEWAEYEAEEKARIAAEKEQLEATRKELEEKQRIVDAAAAKVSAPAPKPTAIPGKVVRQEPSVKATTSTISIPDAIYRLKAMVVPDQQTWDLSDNDVAAIKRVLAYVEEMEGKLGIGEL